jgi:prophage regulatory protein
MRSNSDQLSTHAETELLTGVEPSGMRPLIRILRLKEVMATIGLGRAHIYHMQREGKFPKPVKIGVRAVGWMAEDVFAWIARRANREIATSIQLSEEHGQARPGPKSEAPPAERQIVRNERRGMPQRDYQELERLRAIEQRLRQVTQLQGEIAALLAAPVHRE